MEAQNMEMSLDELRELKNNELRDILRQHKTAGHKVSLGGNKADLVMRCHAVSVSLAKLKDEVGEAREIDVAAISITDKNYADAIKAFGASGFQWSTDMRDLPPFSFIELYEYLVITTSKYNHIKLKGSQYKRLKAFNFFLEGYISTITVASQRGLCYIRASVKASMKNKKYRVLVQLGSDSAVLQAVCECPAGLGTSGQGRCNHIGSVLFALEDFNRQGLRCSPTRVSSTSQLCHWNVPKTRTKPCARPISDIVIQKVHPGKKLKPPKAREVLDVRAEKDRQNNPSASQQVLEKLGKIAPHCAVFICNDAPLPCVSGENVEVDGSHFEVPTEATVQMEAVSVEQSENVEPLPFSDSYDISTAEFKEIVDIQVKESCIQEEKIEEIERATQGQADNDAWWENRLIRMTSSKFGQVVCRRKEPDKLLHSMMYSRNVVTIALQYGRDSESVGAECYRKAFTTDENSIHLREMGILISRDRPYLSCSLDRLVQVTSSTGSFDMGGLEIKCPWSSRGTTIAEACQSKSFCLHTVDGKLQLKTSHQYYTQVQGQLYTSQLPWVDFFVWLSNDHYFCQRISFDRSFWYDFCLPRIDHFYKVAFLPEVLTRRIQRGVRLYLHDGWEPYAAQMKE